MPYIRHKSQTCASGGGVGILDNESNVFAYTGKDLDNGVLATADAMLTYYLESSDSQNFGQDINLTYNIKGNITSELSVYFEITSTSKLGGDSKVLHTFQVVSISKKSDHYYETENVKD